MNLLNRLVQTAIVIAVGTTLLPEITAQLNGRREISNSESLRSAPRRQTYLEYVQERLEVERLMR